MAHASAGNVITDNSYATAYIIIRAKIHCLRREKKKIRK